MQLRQAPPQESESGIWHKYLNNQIKTLYFYLFIYFPPKSICFLPKNKLMILHKAHIHHLT